MDWDEAVDKMRKGEGVVLQGRLVRDDIFEKIVENQIRPLSIGFGVRPRWRPPLTRRQKLRLRWMELRWRFVTAAEVLAGKHECYDPWDD